MNKTRQIKIKLFELGKRQKDLLPELRDKGFTIQASELSAILGEYLTTPKTVEVINACTEILKKWEGDV